MPGVRPWRSRQGSGVYVTEPPAHRALAFDPKLLESMDAVVQMVELRRVIEGEMAALAAQRAARTQRLAIKRALEAIDAATERGELGVDEDMAFHRAIGAATGNPQFVRLLGILEQMSGCELGDVPRGIIADIVEDPGITRDEFYFKRF